MMAPGRIRSERPVPERKHCAEICILLGNNLRMMDAMHGGSDDQQAQDAINRFRDAKIRMGEEVLDDNGQAAERYGAGRRPSTAMTISDRPCVNKASMGWKRNPVVKSRSVSEWWTWCTRHMGATA